VDPPRFLQAVEQADDRAFVQAEAQAVPELQPEGG
jgi:hypothetical protein